MPAFTKRGFWKAAVEPDVAIRALKIAAVVGTILIAINHGDVILGDEDVNWLKVMLTYMVPFAVATYAAAMQKVRDEKK